MANTEPSPGIEKLNEKLQGAVNEAIENNESTNDIFSSLVSCAIITGLKSGASPQELIKAFGSVLKTAVVMTRGS